MKSRKERRQEARTNGATFEPQYNGEVITKAEYNRRTDELKAKRKEAEDKFKNQKEKAELKEVLSKLTTEVATEV